MSKFYRNILLKEVYTCIRPLTLKEAVNLAITIGKHTVLN
ncbi:hypothetical protein BACI348_40991 [Bacillus altitudinis]|uniref:Uncharacterized protein n=1 Tax=Bacillus altitudinis TaxID=293387 RepID=A0A653RKT2_BACAB|nr:hypothetical protein BACI348_40991 [Bacillus altitudinis]